VKKALLWLTVSAVMVALLAPTATAQDYAVGRESAVRPATEVTSQGQKPCSRDAKPTAGSSLAMSFAPVALVSVQQPCIRYLRRTGGPSLVAALVLGSLTVMVGSRVVIRALLRQ